MTRYKYKRPSSKTCQHRPKQHTVTMIGSGAYGVAICDRCGGGMKIEKGEAERILAASARGIKIPL